MAVAVQSAISEAIERCWEGVRDGLYPSYAEAVRGLWDELGPCDEDVIFLAQHGLIQLGAAAQSQRRKTGKPPIAYGAPRGQKQWDEYTLTLATPYEINGEYKAVHDFTIEDIISYKLNQENTITNAKQRSKWADEARKALETHGKRTIKDLPSDTLQTLSKSFARANEV